MNNITVTEDKKISVIDSAIHYGISDIVDFSGEKGFSDLWDYIYDIDDDELSDISPCDVWMSIKDDNDNEYIMQLDWRSDNFQKTLPKLLKSLHQNLDDDEIEDMIDCLVHDMHNDVDRLAVLVDEERKAREIY